jgi:hypothetical protein
MARSGLLTAPPVREATPQIPQDVPCYRIMEEKGFYVDDRLIPQGKIIAWDEEPSLNMDPLNELAVEKYKEFLAKLDTFGKEKSLVDKKHYTPLLTRYEAKLKAEDDFEDGRRAKVLGAQVRQVPVMGAKRGRVKATEIEVADDTIVEPVDRLRLK